LKHKKRLKCLKQKLALKQINTKSKNKGKEGEKITCKFHGGC
jgi:hypothetical protein